jgi:nitrate reductase gamma subunit
MSDIVFFVVFPYLALLLAVIFGVYRYFSDRFSYSSFSSQFLESEQLFWGSVPWHYSILIILIAHLLAALFPGVWGALIGEPVRLYVLELSGLALGFLTVAGTVLLILRRLVNPRITGPRLPVGVGVVSSHGRALALVAG